MKTSENINELAAALAKAQSEIKNATFNRVNPHFKSKYADLASIRDAVTPALAKNGIAVVHSTEPSDGYLLVNTRFIHSSGQWMESQYPIINDVNKPQAMGSSLTYAKRYALSAMSNIASEEDDDGNAATEHGKDKAGPHSPDAEIKRNPKSDMATIKGTVGASKAKLRETSSDLVAKLHECESVGECFAWIEANEDDLNALPPDWVFHMEQRYEEHKALCRGKVAA